MVGPSIGLAALGYHEAAAWVFSISIVTAIAIVVIYERAEVIEGAELHVGGKMGNVLLSAGIVILLGLLLNVITNWLGSWLFN